MGIFKFMQERCSEAVLIMMEPSLKQYLRKRGGKHGLSSYVRSLIVEDMAKNSKDLE